VPAILFGIATGAAIIKSYPDIGAMLSLIGALLTGSMTFLKPSERSSSHKAIANQALAVH
jgi:amino acid permease